MGTTSPSADFPETSFSPAYLVLASHPGRRVDVLRDHARPTAARATSARPPRWSTRLSATSSRAGSRRGASPFPLIQCWIGVDITTTPATRLMSVIGSRMPAAMSGAARCSPRSSRSRPAPGYRPDKADRQPAQRPRVPHRTATGVGGGKVPRAPSCSAKTSGPSGRIPCRATSQLQLPQRGICVVARGRFQGVGPSRGIATATVLTYPADQPMTLAQNRHMSPRQSPPSPSDPCGGAGGAVGDGPRAGQPAASWSALIATRIADRLGLTDHSAIASTTRR